MPGLGGRTLMQALTPPAQTIMDRLRQEDCVNISFCFLPNGTAVSLSLGEGPKKNYITCQDSLEKTLHEAYKRVVGEGIGEG